MRCGRRAGRCSAFDALTAPHDLRSDGAQEVGILILACFVFGALASACGIPQRGLTTSGSSTPWPASRSEATDPYDPSRDPHEDLRGALAQARSQDKGVLLIIGGLWCRWCRELEDFLDRTPDLASSIHRRLLVVRVHYSRELENEDFLRGYPAFPGCPHFIVLDSEGRVVLSQDTSELELGDSYSVQAFQRFLDQAGESLGSGSAK